jgi:hypothetical protein
MLLGRNDIYMDSCALKKIYLSNCKDIICLRIPCLLKQLNILNVFGLLKLETRPLKAMPPNLSTFSYVWDRIHISNHMEMHFKLGKLTSAITIHLIRATPTRPLKIGSLLLIWVLPLFLGSLFFYSTPAEGPIFGPPKLFLYTMTKGARLSSSLSFSNLSSLSHLSISLDTRHGTRWEEELRAGRS